MLCTENVSAIQKIFVHNMFSPCPAKKGASGKDLSVIEQNEAQIDVHAILK